MKFEMNMFTVGLLDKEGLIVNIGLIQRQMTLLNHLVVINTNKPDGVVQLGCDTVDLTYTDNIRGLLESLLHVAKKREDGRVNFGPGGAFSVRAKGSRGDLEAMSLYHCQAVKDWKAHNIGGMYTPSEDDVDELIRIVVSQLPERVDGKGLKTQNSGYSGVTGKFWCMNSTTQNMIDNHPEILHHNIKVNRIAGLPIHIDETIERGVIKLSGDDREVIFNPKQPTLNTLKSKLQEILNNAK